MVFAAANANICCWGSICSFGQFSWLSPFGNHSAEMGSSEVKQAYMLSNNGLNDQIVTVGSLFFMGVSNYWI